jgi:hypothetical protein
MTMNIYLIDQCRVLNEGKNEHFNKKRVEPYV